jgi:very-short-patch-repair endonuclease
MHLNHHYNKNLKEFARELRTNTQSKAEKYIWKAILSRKQSGYKFLRQRPIDNFIVDFFSPSLKLIIEIDGNSHLNKGSYDSYRENKLERFGYKLVRFKEGEVLNNISDVIDQIYHIIHCLETSHLPNPPQGGSCT